MDVVRTVRGACVESTAVRVDEGCCAAQGVRAGSSNGAVLGTCARSSEGAALGARSSGQETDVALDARVAQDDQASGAALTARAASRPRFRPLNAAGEVLATCVALVIARGVAAAPCLRVA